MALIAGVQYSGTPAGTIMACATNSALPMTLLCDGSAINRTTYSALFNAINFIFTSVTRNGTTTLTIGGGQNPQTLGVVAGMPISGTGIAGGTTVSSVTSSTIVLSSAASGSGTDTAVVCPYGVGDGSTTFNVPDTRNVFLRGANASTRTINSISYPAAVRGTTYGDKMQGHRHNRNTNGTSEFVVDNVGGSVAFTGGGSRQISYTTTGDGNIAGTNGTPRTGDETAPVHLGVNYCIAY